MIPGPSVSGTEFPQLQRGGIDDPCPVGAVTGASPAESGGWGGGTGSQSGWAQVPVPVCRVTPLSLGFSFWRQGSSRCPPGRVVSLLLWSLFRDPSSDGLGTPPPLPQRPRLSWVAGTQSPVSASRPRE